MTDLLCDRAEFPLLESAHRAAEAAARAARVEIRCLDDIGDLEAIQLLCERVWQTGANRPPIGADVLRALAKAGSYVSGAYDGGELVGTCFGFCSPPARASLHSHIAGVLPEVQKRSVGYALKLHQRAWALERGIREVRWTYDPLVRRNAYFNLSKLGARAAEYLPNFYGPIDDGVNRSDDSDRIMVSWRLDAPDVTSACSGKPLFDGVPAAPAADTAVALGASADGAPVAEAYDRRARTLLVAVPADIEALRRDQPDCAERWRTTVREVLGGLLAVGARIRGFDRTGWYVVENAAEAPKEQA
ncbi:GNAT family N-acetyltransferase [Streptomyces sp. NPDC051976]|uniref:GNAT family N-acetyltransferase n=1 Tax=Streptomyces sp. NPDC051976 TaxID=3154947 RepID=UPI003445AD43